MAPPHIVGPHRIWPVFLQDIPTPFLSFNLPYCMPEPCPFKTKFEAAYTSEE